MNSQPLTHSLAQHGVTQAAPRLRLVKGSATVAPTRSPEATVVSLPLWRLAKRMGLHGQTAEHIVAATVLRALVAAGAIPVEARDVVGMMRWAIRGAESSADTFPRDAA